MAMAKFNRFYQSNTICKEKIKNNGTNNSIGR